MLTGELVLVGTDGQGVGHVYAFERSSGRVRWKYAAGENVPSDIVGSGSTAFALTQSDELLALDLANGTLRWRFRSSGAELGRERLDSSPVASGGHVYFSGRDGIIYALAEEDGQVVWSYDMGTPYITTPVIHEGALYVGTGDGRIARFDARLGQLLDEFSVAGPVAVGYRLAAEPEGIFGYLASEESGRGFAARALFLLAPGFDGVRWTRSNMSWTSPRPFSWRNGVVVGDRSGQVVALRSADGAEQWRLQLEGVVRGIGGRDDLLFVGMLDGKLHAYRLND